MATPLADHRPDEALHLLGARLDDLSRRAAGGVLSASSFLSPREVKYAARQLSSRLSAGTAVLWGGYPSAERRRAILLPDYTEGLVDPAALAADPPAALAAAGFSDLADEVREAVCLLSVRGSGYRPLSHRDYLGAILGLGLERDAIGDILVADTDEAPAALILTDRRLSDFLLSDLQKVATDTVRVSRPDPAAVTIPARRTEPVRDTVASERLDCVVAALCNLSREKAQSAIRQGLCELDYEPATDCDRPVAPPATLTVRGYGKFLVEAFDGETRKGRMRLVAGKYV